MPKVFEYCVCQVQHDRVTFANYQWQGSAPMDTSKSQESIASCPVMWEYLWSMGAEGWELVSTVDRAATPETALMLLFLKREVA